MQKHSWPHNREKLGGAGTGEESLHTTHSEYTIISFLVQIPYDLDSAGYSQCTVKTVAYSQRLT